MVLHNFNKIIFLILIYFSIFSFCVNFNCRKNSTDICGNNTFCNESGICVCNNFYFGINCEKKLSDNDSVKINEGIESGSFTLMILCLSIISPFSFVLGFFLMFIFLKGRDGTYIN